ncbi:MAG: tyrosine-type recombinase/integrase, partial [Gemmataceae bacterium]
MPQSNSTAPNPSGKPTKPYPTYPLTPHATRRWCKKIEGKLHYFGRWEDPEGALRKYEAFIKGTIVDRNTTGYNQSGDSGKPSKPYSAFPLTPHPSGQWCKKIRGKLYYFGPWDDPDGALAKYLEEKDALHAGCKPRTDREGTTIKEMVNKFLNAKRASVDSGELAYRTWEDYKAACDLLTQHFGKGRRVDDLDPEDFGELRKKLACKWGPKTVCNAIQRIRVVFKFAVDNGLTDHLIRYGQGFKRPSQKTLRLERARKGPKLFTPAEVRQLLDVATVPVRAMILLGINCGMGNADCGVLPLSDVDLERRIIDIPRPKTGIPRRCPLWPETMGAIRAALDCRPEPEQEEHAGLVFITKYGKPWAKLTADQTLAKEFGKLLKALGINGKKGLGFYTLRHTFRTVADESKDQPAVDFIMGHEVPHMSAVYRET